LIDTTMKFLSPKSNPPLLTPFRDEVLSKEALFERASKLADECQLAVEKSRATHLTKRFKANCLALEQAYFYLSRSDGERETLTAGAEWLLDNFHVVQQQVRQIKRDLPHAYYRSLPQISNEDWKEFPRVYRLACEYVRHTDGVVDADLLAEFMRGYQVSALPEHVLTIGELWAVPIMLRLVLIENLRRLIDWSLVIGERKQAAEEFCKHSIDRAKSSSTEIMIELVRACDHQPEVIDFAAAHILRRLRARGSVASLAIQWFDQTLQERDIDPYELLRLSQQRQAADQISFGNTMSSLKAIASIDWRDWFESVSVVDKILGSEQGGGYTLNDFSTKDRCRHRIEYYARLAKTNEVEIAQAAVSLADQALIDQRPEYEHSVAYFLFDSGQSRLSSALKLSRSPIELLSNFLKDKIFWFYLLFLMTVTVGVSLFAGVYIYEQLQNIGLTLIVALIIAVPASEFAVQFLNWLATRIFSPDTLPRISLEQPVSKEHRTAVAVQTILGDFSAIDRMMQAQEIRFLGNDDPNLLYVTLADFPDAKTETSEQDSRIVEYATKRIKELNQQYAQEKSPRFFLLFRKRIWNESESCFMGWERKRGKILEFNRLIRGDGNTSFSHVVGDLSLLRSCRYVITLDSDTRLPRDAARKLVATISHSLNRPVVDPDSKVVWRGYGIIQPRVGITLESSIITPFARLFSGHSGLDPYTRTVSDVYQDLFGEGSYVGKGIYDVDAFEEAVGSRVPENSLLSHDLFEGIYARSGLASDIELFDDFPARFHAYAKREHRWIRGDWQLLPWLFSPFRGASRFASGANIAQVSTLGRWKIFDNLRRSLVAPAVFLLFFILWIFSPASLVVGLLGLLFLLSFPLISILFGIIIDLPFKYSISSYVRSLLSDLKKSTLQLVHFVTFLPQISYLHLHAVFITLYRVLVSKQNLLEWETADATEKRLGGDLPSFIAFMKPGLLLTLLLHLVLIVVLPASELLLTVPFFMLWYCSPYMAWKLSRESSVKPLLINSSQEQYLEDLAYDTWRYFEQFLNDEYHYLIPDNLQVVPQHVVAPRTSPTNLSLSLLSVVAAYDLGYLSLPQALTLLGKIGDSLLRLEKFHGHFLNWYDIVSLQALAPRYVSTVDSGNFAGHLIAILVLLDECDNTPLYSTGYWQGILSKFRTSSELGNLLQRERRPDTLLELYELYSKMLEVPVDQDDGTDFQSIEDQIEELKVLAPWLKFPEQLNRAAQESEELAGLLVKARELTLKDSTGRQLQALNDQFISVFDTLKTESKTLIKEITDRIKLAKERLGETAELIERTKAAFDFLVKEMDFSFLYDQKKKLFFIGYDIDNGHYDKSYYDLLASEARLASLVAIAKNDVPQSHWFSLGRSLVETPGGKALLSWSGTMFEYLMPLLVTRDYPGTLLHETYCAVVKAQKSYAQQRRVPWGISESGYSGVDFEKTYQYRAFGVPGLGLKRGLGEDLVVSPYSTALALEFDPSRSLENLKRLEKLGVRGEYGFYEAIDFTSERLSQDESFHIVRSFLAHHQGMTLIAVTNVLRDAVFRKRFHSHPAIKACELLLQERFPARIPSISPHRAEQLDSFYSKAGERAVRTELVSSPHTSHPRLRILSNGRLTVCVDNAGGGFIKLLPDIHLTRWRSEPTLPEHGLFIYIHDTATDALWSTAYLPTRVEADSYQVLFQPDKVEFHRRDYGVTTHTEITVSPEEPVEIRKVTLTNTTAFSKELEITSYSEVCLSTLPSDIAHPAFSKMFVQVETLAEYDALLFQRRARSEGEPEHFLFHLVTMPVVWAPVRATLQRDRFIGRGRSLEAPRFFFSQSEEDFSEGALLDPIMSLSSRVEVDSGSSQAICFVTGVASSRDEALELIRKYRDQQQIVRAFELAWSQSDIELRHDQFSLAQVHSFQHLAHGIIYSLAELRSSSRTITKGAQSQSSLWRLGISGDLPIVLLEISDPAQFSLAQEMLLAHEYLRQRGIAFDLVMVNEYPGGYMQHLHEDLDALIRSGYSRHIVDRPGGVFLRIISQMSDSEIMQLRSIASVALHGANGNLAKQLPSFEETKYPRDRSRSTFNNQAARRETIDKSRQVVSDEMLEFDNGIGGFAPDGKSYVMNVSQDNLPPAPWSNVIGSENFGFLITESGAGYTWAENSRENRLSSWSNDPVLDPQAEVLYLRDCDNGHFWSPTPLPVPPASQIRVEHGPGYSSFKALDRDVESLLTVSGDISQSVKWYSLKLRNRGPSRKRIECYFSVDCVLGLHRNETARHLIGKFDTACQMLYVQNPFHITYPGQVAFVGSNREIKSYSCDRAEFFGRNSSRLSPGLLVQNRSKGVPDLLGSRRGQQIELSGSQGAGFDLGMIVQVYVEVEAGEEREVQFYLAHAHSLTEARAQSRRHASVQTREAALNTGKDFWDKITDEIQVATPDRSFDILVNSWLLYQTLSCRIFARSGFYQSSGAFGFRDQLQDSLAFLVTNPEITRKQILLHASRQFVEGDVQHWWHMPGGQGIRTKISDGYLWLPYAVAEYLKLTGDDSILNEQVPFLEGPPLADNEMEVFSTPDISSHSGTLYEHCIMALDRALVFGSKGLPLIGGGDWNDGMNRVGVDGKGQSVWLGWFLSGILKHWAKIVESRRDSYRSSEYGQQLENLVSSIESNCWDGKWYHRAYFDDGTPLGSDIREECKIDSLAQSWSVISGLGDPDRQTESMESVYENLVKTESRLIALLWPPFHKSDPSPGYIQGYPRGLRENGGQYTHAAAWVIMAEAMMGHGARAHELFSMINPINHTRLPEDVARYVTEPYVTCGDVYSVEPYIGRGGWSWYTGSSSWLYRVAVEHILGLKVHRGESFTLEPCVPSDWKEFKLDYRHHKGGIYHCTVQNPNGVQSGVVSVRRDGNIIADKVIALDLKEGQECEIVVEMG